MTISTHFWPRIFPSGSTTAYFFGLLHSTWRHSWIFTQGKYWFLFSSEPYFITIPHILLSSIGQSQGHLRDWFEPDKWSSTHFECDVKLVRIVDGNNSLVSCLILKVEVQLDREDKNGNLPVQDWGRGQPWSGTHLGFFLHQPDQKSKFSVQLMASIPLCKAWWPPLPPHPHPHMSQLSSPLLPGRLLLLLIMQKKRNVSQPQSTLPKPSMTF